MGRLQFEELRGVLSALLLTTLHLQHQLLTLLPPVAQLLFQDALFLIQRLATITSLEGRTTKAEGLVIITCQLPFLSYDQLIIDYIDKVGYSAPLPCFNVSSYLLQVYAEVLHLSLESLLGLLQRGALSLGGLHRLLSLLEPRRQLLPGTHTNVWI
jgi:hypothetical protein